MLKNLLFRGKNLEYEIRGEGPAVMLVHGFTEDRRIWDPLLNGMENNYKWILPDLPGSGQSDFNDSLSGLADFAEALRAITEQENIRELVLIGHSMGGYISLAFAEKYPERLLSLGLFHSSSYADSTEKKEGRDKNISFIQKNGAEPFVTQSLPGLYSGGFAAENPQEIQKQILRYANFKPESLVLYLAAMKQRPATTGVLKSFTRPILFIMGEEDKAVPLKDALEQCHLPRISYIHILTHTAHMGMIESTIQCRTIIDRFLQQIPV
jgi:pimeloyl-ACP methyl ester carboxylesterase